MPLTQPSSDRVEVVERHLGDELRFAARQLATLHDVPAHGWASVPALRSVFEVAAAVRRARELRASTGASRERCLQDACSELGMPYETVRSRLYRALCRAYRRDKVRRP